MGKKVAMFFLPGRNKLITKFLFTYIPLVFIPLLLIGLLMITATDNFMTNSIEEKHIEIGKIAASEIYLYVENAHNRIKDLSFSPAIIELKSFQISTVTNKLIEREKIFRKILILNKDGYVISTTSFYDDTTNYSNETFFKNSIEGKDYISPLIIEEEALPFIIISVPVVYLNNIIAVLMAEVDLKSIWDLVDNISFKDEGRIMLISNEGKIIAHPRREKVYARENLSHLKIVRDLLNGNTGIGRFKNKDGIEMISSYRKIEELNWGLITYQPVEKAFSLTRKMKFQFTLILALSTIIAIIISILITQNLLKPIRKLVSGVKAFSSGNLDYKIQTSETNEIGLLATEFNKMTSSIKDYQNKLKEAERLATLSKFASVVAHEIRNPLNAMMINLEIIKRDLTKKHYSEKLRKYVEIIYSEILRMDKLINNYLSLSRPSPLSLSKGEIQNVLDEVIISNQAKALNQGVRIERKYFINPKINMDKSQLKQVFLNILINALQSMPGGGILNIYILDKDTFKNKFDEKFKPKNGETLIVFSDTGKGISPDKIPEVFDFFYSTKKKGTGLGLPIARQIIQAHKGRIDLKSNLKEGTSIFIYLPKS